MAGKNASSKRKSVPPVQLGYTALMCSSAAEASALRTQDSRSLSTGFAVDTAHIEHQPAFQVGLIKIIWILWNLVNFCSIASNTHIIELSLQSK